MFMNSNRFSIPGPAKAQLLFVLRFPVAIWYGPGGTSGQIVPSKRAMIKPETGEHAGRLSIRTCCLDPPKTSDYEMQGIENVDRKCWTSVWFTYGSASIVRVEEHVLCPPYRKESLHISLMRMNEVS